MTSTSVSNLAHAQGAQQLLSKTGKLWLAVIGGLFIGFHWYVIYKMTRIGLNDSDWSHVLIIPFISLYYIHLNRKQIMATPRRVCVWGLPFVVAGIAGFVLGIFPIQNDMAMGYSMIMTLFGIVLLLLGPAMMRHLWFPIAFLVFAIKVSDAIWSRVASEMQTIAAKGAVVFLEVTSGLTGMHADLRGSTIDLDYGQPNAPTAMNVAEACAGMRMLMAFLALGVALAFLFPRLWWQRLVMILLAGPIAILVNAARVAVLGWLHLIDPSLAQGDFHLLVGMLMLLPAAGLLMLVGWCLDKAVIIEGGTKQPPRPLPFDHDPNQLHLSPNALIKGAGIGTAIIVLLGVSYMMLVNRLALGEAIGWLGAGTSTAVMAVAGVLFLVGMAVAWVWIRRGERHHQLALSQGVVGGMLLAAALGQHAAINTMEVALTKQPLPLRHGFALSFPNQAGDWEMLHHDPRLSKDIESELDTDEYFNRYYVDTASGLSLYDVDKQTHDDTPGGRLIGWDGIEKPGQIAKIHVAYYTGMLDTVPHVPDRCWVVAGSRPVYKQTHTLNLSRDDYRPDPEHEGLILAESEGFDKTVRLPSDQIEAKVFSGADPDGNVTTALYFFLASGDAIASSHEVRFSFNFKDRYSYYCKVEVMFPGVNDPDEVARHAENLLSDMLPEIMACLPDWTEVQAGQYPDNNSAGDDAAPVPAKEKD